MKSTSNSFATSGKLNWNSFVTSVKWSKLFHNMWCAYIQILIENSCWFDFLNYSRSSLVDSNESFSKLLDFRMLNSGSKMKLFWKAWAINPSHLLCLLEHVIVIAVIIHICTEHIAHMNLNIVFVVKITSTKKPITLYIVRFLIWILGYFKRVVQRLCFYHCSKCYRMLGLCFYS